MTYYHGTTVGGLTVLRPHASPHNNLEKPCVYLTTSTALAGVYIWPHPFKWMTFEVHDGLPVYNESFAGGLKWFYSGVRGYVYTCSGDWPTDAGTGISLAAVSPDPVPVTGCRAVEDTYAYLCACEREGTLVIQRYETLTPEQRERDRRMVLSAIGRYGLLAGRHPLSAFVRETFPTCWATAEIAARQPEKEESL